MSRGEWKDHTKKEINLNIRIEEELMKELNEKCQEEGTKKSDVLRGLIRDYVRLGTKDKEIKC
jgi:metal-responsive CopG/Arc/MetJ family transcriptional regulator